MCFSSTASFALSGLLAGGGVFCLWKADKSDHRYLPMAFMPVAVAVQQFAEGLAWMGLETGDAALIKRSAMTYMFFVWVFWPVWTAFAAYALESDMGRKRLFLKFIAAGFIAGLVLYLPYIVRPDWLQVESVKHSLSYSTTILPDKIMPREVTTLIYLFLVGGTPLFSSFRAVRIFGWLLIFFVPLTYIFFAYTYISVLCFFAAGATVYLIFIIVEDKCRRGAEQPVFISRKPRA